MSLVAIFLIALLVVEILPWSKDMSLLVSAILFGIIILKVYVSEFSFTSKVLNFYILRTIGKISYILFLANMLFKNFVEHYTKKELLDLNSFSKLISITILMIISWFIYNYFENPLRNYLNKRFQLK
jgi:peptidoglycan/LPS O-acetylase OafA/YrhL